MNLDLTKDGWSIVFKDPPWKHYVQLSDLELYDYVMSDLLVSVSYQDEELDIDSIGYNSSLEVVRLVVAKLNNLPFEQDE